MKVLRSILASVALLASCGGRSMIDVEWDDVGGSGNGGSGAALNGGSAQLQGGALPALGGAVAFGGYGPGGAPGLGGSTVAAGGTIMTQAGRSSVLGGSTFGGAGGRRGRGVGGTGVGGTAVAGGVSAGAPGAGGVPMCPGLLSPNEDLIDSMDDGDRFILRSGGRVGAWSDGHDATGGTMYPEPGTPFVMTASGNDCFGNAAYLKGGVFTDWGANFGFGLGSPYDASGYTGFSFWARVEAGSIATLRVGFPDKNSHPDGGLCVANASDPKSCWDNHKARRLLTSNWTKYVVSFSELRQDAWGNLGPFDPKTLFGVLFEIPANGTFMIWVDEVAFVR